MMFNVAIFVDGREDPIQLGGIVNSSVFTNDAYDVFVAEDGRRLYFKTNTINAVMFNPNTTTPEKTEEDSDNNKEAAE